MPRRRYSRGHARTRRRYGGKGGSLTGGTGDVNPQWFNLQDLNVTLTGTGGSAAFVAADVVSRSAESIVPLQQQALMASRGSKSMVMEFLKVEFFKTADASTIPQAGRLAVTTRSVAGDAGVAAAGGLSSGSCNPNQPHVIASTSFSAAADAFDVNATSSFTRNHLSPEGHHIWLTDVRCVFFCSC